MACDKLKGVYTRYKFFLGEDSSLNNFHWLDIAKYVDSISFS